MSGSRSIEVIRMPKWGLSMQEGTITAWHVAPGERVTPGTPLCDIETAKITNEFEAPLAGTVARLLARAGEVVQIGRLIAVLAGEGVTATEIDAVVAAEAQDDVAASHEAVRPELRRVAAGEGEIAYLEAGENAGAATVVFLHGFGGDHGNWTMTQSAVAERFRTIAIDLPGHGASSRHVGDGSGAAIAALVGLAVNQLCPGPAHLVAHSFGAAIAQGLARQKQRAIASMTLLAPIGMGAEVNPAYMRGFMAAQRKRDLRPIMEMLFANPGLLSREMVSEALHLLEDAATRASLQRIADTLMARGSSLTVPDFPDTRWQVIWGAQDRVLPLPPALRSVLNERLHLADNCGHMPQLEAAERVNAWVLAFLTG